MKQIEKTVFISYRRANSAWALAIYQDLTRHGFDVFIDFRSIASGDFEQAIVENIKGRAHFIVLLTPSALQKCNNPSDWLRREIELALDAKCNIVPIMLEGFDFSSAMISKQLVGRLGDLKKYNGLSMPVEYFEEAMTRLRDRYLNIPLDSVLHPLSEQSRGIAQSQQIAAGAAPKVSSNDLEAQQWFEKGYVLESQNDLENAILAYTSSIRLNPNFTEAYNNRGSIREIQGDLDGALNDYFQAIGLDPDNAHIYTNRGNVYLSKGELENALADYEEAVNLNPILFAPIFNCGVVLSRQGEIDKAIIAYTKAIHLEPALAQPYLNRATLWVNKDDLHAALADYKKYLELGGGENNAEVKNRILDIEWNLNSKKSP